MRFRRLLFVCAVTAVGTVPGHAQTVEWDRVLQPGEAIRVTYCETDCDSSRLMARGELRAFADASLHLEPGAAMRLRLVEGDSRTYPRVLSVRPDRVRIRTPGGPAWTPFRSGWSVDDDGLSIPFPGVTRIETRIPREPQVGAVRGAALGSLTLAVGLGGWAYLDSMNQPFAPPVIIGLLMGGIGAVVGLPVGGVVGWFFPGTYWSEVTADRPNGPAPGLD